MENGGLSFADLLIDSTVNPVFRFSQTVWHATDVPLNFAILQRKIEEAVDKLKATKDPSHRREVLRELRRLLGEADNALSPVWEQPSDHNRED